MGPGAKTVAISTSREKLGSWLDLSEEGVNPAAASTRVTWYWEKKNIRKYYFPPATGVIHLDGYTREHETGREVSCHRDFPHDPPSLKFRIVILRRPRDALSNVRDKCRVRSPNLAFIRRVDSYAENTYKGDG